MKLNDIFIFTCKFSSFFNNFSWREYHWNAASDAIGYAKHGCLQNNHEFTDDFRVEWMLNYYD